MKRLKWVCIGLMVVALAFGFTACSAKEEASQGGNATLEDQAQPEEQAAQPSEATDPEQSAEVQSSAPEASPEVQPQDAAQAPETGEAAGETGKAEVAEIMGTVLDSGGEIVVFTDQGNYAVTGEDLSSMVGKTVRVLGSLQEDEGRRTIKVISVYEIK